MKFLRQSTNSQSRLLGPFVDSTDGTTAETALTIANTDIRLSANGGNMVSKNNGGGTHDELGYYTVTYDSTDTAAVGSLRVVCKMAGALVVEDHFWVFEEAVYDAFFASTAAGYVSGAFASVPPSTLSGVIIQSGAYATVLSANLSGVIANSGLFATVLPASLSGVVIQSGAYSTVLKENLSGVVANSGLFVTATATIASGALSGQLVDVLINNDKSGYTAGSLSGTTYIASGPFVNVPRDTLSGIIVQSGAHVTVPPATLSGVVIQSGAYSTVLKENLSGVVANSGLFVNATATVQSGAVYLASGHMGFYSGNIYPASGVYVNATATIGSGALSGQLVDVLINNDKSGYTATPLSGTTYIASGPFVNVPVSTLSGVRPQSGAHVTVPRATLSGVITQSGAYTTVLPANLSGVVANSGLFVNATASIASGDVYLASGSLVGLLSGQYTLPYSGQLSGQQVTARTVSDKSGYVTSPLSGTVHLASGMSDVILPEGLLTYDFSGAPNVSGERNLLNAARKLVNRWSTAVASGYLYVYAEDDSTLALSQAIGSVSGAEPITSLDTQ